MAIPCPINPILDLPLQGLEVMPILAITRGLQSQTTVLLYSSHVEASEIL